MCFSDNCSGDGLGASLLAGCLLWTSVAPWLQSGANVFMAVCILLRTDDAEIFPHTVKSVCWQYKPNK